MEGYSVELPSPFHFKGTTQEAKDKELEAYLRRLSLAIETNIKRLANKSVRITT